MKVNELIYYLSKVSDKSKEICFYNSIYHITNAIIEYGNIYLSVEAMNKPLSVRQLVVKLIKLDKLHYKISTPLPRDVKFIAEYSNMVLIGVTYQTIPPCYTMLFIDENV